MKTKLLILLLFAFSLGNAQTISTMAGSTSGYVEGIGTAARFNSPYGIAFDGGGAVVVADQGNYKVRKIFSDNSTALLAGSTFGFVNGTGAAAKFGNVAGVARDGFNNTFICDSENNCIRKITVTGVVTTFAGGTLGTADGTGTAAQFNRPYGLAIDASGNLYVSDTYNHRIRKITSAGVVTTLAGSNQGFTNGTGTAAQFDYPFGIAVDASGNVYVGENCRVRKITTAGVVTTFAGGTQGYLNGTGTNARFNNGLNGIAIDTAGNLYVTDTFNYVIRKITPSAVVTTYAGTGSTGSVDGDVSVATFNTLVGITIDPVNTILYASEYGNHRIRKIVPAVPATLPVISAINLAVGSNSATISYSLNANNGATTSIVKYGLTSGSLSSQVAGFSVSGSSVTPGSASISGILPSTLYYYQIEATNSAGTAVSTIGNFTTLASVVTTPITIAEYSFDNTYNNINGNSPFTSNAGTSFTTDRHNNANGAININDTGTSATIVGLPYGANPRTISVWAKTNVFDSQINYIFHYGTSANGNGLALRPTTILYFANAGANLETANTYTNTTWVHYVCTYDGSTATVYKNGVLFSSGAKSFNTASALDVFKLGLTESGTATYFNGAIDDLKIYNYVLDQADITSLYNNNTLSSSDFAQNNLEVSLYPNPVNDVLNIETTLEVKSVEIYNIQGQKVLSSNQKQINVSDLAAGMYMVRIQDAENNSAIKKVIIK